MDTTAQDLLRIKEHRDKAKSEHDRLIGQRDQVFQQLQMDYNCSTVAEAQAYLEALGADEARLDKELRDGVADLKGELGW